MKRLCKAGSDLHARIVCVTLACDIEKTTTWGQFFVSRGRGIVRGALANSNVIRANGHAVRAQKRGVDLLLIARHHREFLVREHQWLVANLGKRELNHGAIN